MTGTPDRLRWPRRGQFADHGRGIRVQGPNGTIPTDDLDDDAVEHLLDRGFVPVDDDQDGSAPSDGDDEVTEIDELDAEDIGASGPLPFNPDSHSIPDIRELVQDVDDPEAVRALANLEAEGEDRKGAADAFDDRLDELNSDAGD